MDFENFSGEIQESQENDNEKENEKNMPKSYLSTKIEKYIEQSSWVTPSLPEGKSLNNSYLKHEVNTLIDMLKECKLDGTSDEYKGVMKEIAKKITIDLDTFNVGGIDRNDKGVVADIFENMKFVARAIPEEDKDGGAEINTEEASKFDEFVINLKILQQDIQDILPVEMIHNYKHNYILKLEAHSLIDLLKKQDYFSAPEDCKALLKGIIEKIQNEMNEFDETDLDESSKKKIEEVRKGIELILSYL
jgi:hypothetical protein